jgi:hypothetical protein
MATVPSIRIVKTFPFKGGSRLWSNRYHFLGGTPADATHWHTLMDNVVTAEKAALGQDNTIVEALGYAAGSDVPVATKVYSTAGTHTSTGGNSCPGECAQLLRFATAARSTKNHPIYCFNYFHGFYVPVTTSGNADVPLASMVTSLATYGTAWISGFSDGTITATRCSPAGHAATGVVSEEYVTHRDFPYSSSV